MANFWMILFLKFSQVVRVFRPYASCNTEHVRAKGL